MIDWWGSIKVLQGQRRWGSEDQQSNKEMNVGCIQNKITNCMKSFRTRSWDEKSPKSVCTLAFYIHSNKADCFMFNFVTLLPRNNRQCWNTKKELRVNSNKINQKQKMDLAEEQVEEVSASGSPVSSAAHMSRKKRVSQEICKKKTALSCYRRTTATPLR